MIKLKVLITGASGQIGTCLRIGFKSDYDLRAFDLNAIDGDPQSIVGDLQDFSLMKSAMQDIDVVVHLAAIPHEAPFVEKLVPSNIIGLYNTYQAACEAGVRRIVFASSCHTVTQYPADHTVKVTDPVRPLSIYGATKVFGEVLGRYYHDHHGIEFIGLRIGWFLPYSSNILGSNTEARDLWLSPGDAVRLFRRAIEKKGIGYAVIFGTSITQRERLSLRPARELLGFEPQDNIAKIPLHRKETRKQRIRAWLFNSSK